MKMYIQDGDWEPLGQMYDQLKSSDWSEFAATFPNQPDSWVWSWIGMNGNFDPLPYWKRIDQDVFIAYGARDEDDNVPVYESVYLLHDTFTQNGKTNYTIKIYDTGHALYEDDKAEIRKEFIDDLLAWLNAL
jgi:pimeloyl-ACP methyl ester carboxylesterase